MKKTLLSLRFSLLAVLLFGSTLGMKAQITELFVDLKENHPIISENIRKYTAYFKSTPFVSINDEGRKEMIFGIPYLQTLGGKINGIIPGNTIYYRIKTPSGQNIFGEYTIPEVDNKRKDTLIIDLLSTHHLVFFDRVKGVEGEMLDDAMIYYDINAGDPKEAKDKVFQYKDWYDEYYEQDEEEGYGKGLKYLFLEKDHTFTYLLNPGNTKYLPVYGEIGAVDTLRFDFSKGRTVRYGLKDLDGAPCRVDWKHVNFFTSYRGESELDSGENVRFSGGTIRPDSSYTSENGEYTWAEFHALPGEQHIWFESSEFNEDDMLESYEFSDFHDSFVKHSHFTVEEGEGPQNVWLDFSKFNALTVRFSGFTIPEISRYRINRDCALTLYNPDGNYNLFGDKETLNSMDNMKLKIEDNTIIGRSFIGNQFTNVTTNVSNLPIYPLPEPEQRNVELKDDVTIEYDISNYRPVAFVVYKNKNQYGIGIHVNDISMSAVYSGVSTLGDIRVDTAVVLLGVGEHQVDIYAGDSSYHETVTVGKNDSIIVKEIGKDLLSTVVFTFKKNFALKDDMFSLIPQLRYRRVASLSSYSAEIDILTGKAEIIVAKGDSLNWYLPDYVLIDGVTTGKILPQNDVENFEIDLNNFRMCALNSNFKNIVWTMDNEELTSNSYYMGAASYYLYVPSGCKVTLDYISPQYYDLTDKITYYNLSHVVTADTLLSMPSYNKTFGPEYLTTFVRGNDAENGVQVTALDYYNANVTYAESEGENVFRLFPGRYQATSEKGEVVLFEKHEGEAVTIDFNNPPTGISDVTVEDIKEVARYNSDGRRIAAPMRGLNIVVYSGGEVRKVFIE